MIYKRKFDNFVPQFLAVTLTWIHVNRYDPREVRVSSIDEQLVTENLNFVAFSLRFFNYNPDSKVISNRISYTKIIYIMKTKYFMPFGRIFFEQLQFYF